MIAMYYPALLIAGGGKKSIQNDITGDRNYEN